MWARTPLLHQSSHRWYMKSWGAFMSSKRERIILLAGALEEVFVEEEAEAGDQGSVVRTREGEGDAQLDGEGRDIRLVGPITSSIDDVAAALGLEVEQIVGDGAELEVELEDREAEDLVDIRVAQRAQVDGCPFFDASTNLASGAVQPWR